MNGITRVAIVAFAVALGAGACRNENNKERTEKERQSGREKTAVYVVDRIDGDAVVLRARALPTEATEMQGGRELRTTRIQFRDLAGKEAREDMVVEVLAGADGTPRIIRIRADEEKARDQPSAPDQPGTEAPK